MAVVATNLDFIDALRVGSGAGRSQADDGLTGNICSPPRGFLGRRDRTQISVRVRCRHHVPQNGQPPINLSKQLLIQSTYDVEQIIRGDMVRAIALAVDAAAIEGGATGIRVLMTSNIGEINASQGAAIGRTSAWKKRLPWIILASPNPKVRGQLKNTHVGTDQRMIWSENGNSRWVPL